MDNWHRVPVKHAKLFYPNTWPTTRLLPEVYWQLAEMAGPGREKEWTGPFDQADTGGLSWLWRTERSALANLGVYAFYFKDKDKAAWFKLTYG